MICKGCDLPIKPKEEWVDCTDGPCHKLCFDIQVAGLESEIITAMRSQPDKYEEVREGVFIER